MKIAQINSGIMQKAKKIIPSKESYQGISDACIHAVICTNTGFTPIELKNFVEGIVTNAYFASKTETAYNLGIVLKRTFKLLKNPSAFIKEVKPANIFDNNLKTNEEIKFYPPNRKLDILRKNSTKI